LSAFGSGTFGAGPFGGTVAWTATTTPADLAEATTSDPPTATVTATAVPDGVAVGVDSDQPDATETGDRAATPDAIADTAGVDNPAVTFTTAATTGDLAIDVATADPAAVAVALPTGIAETALAGTPTAAFSTTAEPAGVAAPLTCDTPTTTTPYLGTATPDGLRITLSPNQPAATFPPAAPTPTYVPIAAPTPAPRPTTHILGVGPWNTGIQWKGTPNYGQPAGTYPSVPSTTLPDTATKSFTLRLNAADEARTDFTLPRNKAILVEQRSTDLWWLRQDPERQTLDAIGRFNADTVDMSMDDNGQIRVSATYADYRALLEDRLILDVANHPAAGLSSWGKGTNIIDILRFVVPTNMNLDLTEITEGTSVFVGTITEPVELPPGTSVAEAITNLQSISTLPTFEWWVEMVDNIGSRPKLRLAPHRRGADNGVYLVDTGTGQSPITRWQIQAAGNKYANTLYFSDSAGGVVYRIPTDVTTYGQRDAQETDTSIRPAGNLPRIQAAAQRRLTELSNQQITWTLHLRTGFWQGRSHIDVGDTVTAKIALGGELITGTHRVSEISVDIDESGTEAVTLTLGPPKPAKDPRSRYSPAARMVRTLKNYTRQS
jgi:hypothetical protein